jgi:hypothetical protein
MGRGDYAKTKHSRVHASGTITACWFAKEYGIAYLQRRMLKLYDQDSDLREIIVPTRRNAA